MSTPTEALKAQSEAVTEVRQHRVVQRGGLFNNRKEDIIQLGKQTQKICHKCSKKGHIARECRTKVI